MTGSARPLLIIGFSLVAALASSQSLYGQSNCGYCTDTWSDYDGAYVHEFGATGALLSCGPGSELCHTYQAWLICTNYHGRCEWASGEMIDKALATLASPDATKIRQILIDFGEGAILNHDAQSLDLLSCEGTLIARVPISTELLAVSSP